MVVVRVKIQVQADIWNRARPDHRLVHSHFAGLCGIAIQSCRSLMETKEPVEREDALAGSKHEH
jgi:hypothetical protein